MDAPLAAVGCGDPPEPRCGVADWFTATIPKDNEVVLEFLERITQYAPYWSALWWPAAATAPLVITAVAQRELCISARLGITGRCAGDETFSAAAHVGAAMQRGPHDNPKDDDSDPAGRDG